MAAQRLIVLVAILLSPSAVPRMQSAGGKRWFVAPVPDPQRFRLDDHNSGARAATWVFGYPFVCYFQVGCEFRTKGGSMLFWPSTYAQPGLRQRVSLAALAGDLALAIGISIVVLIAASRFISYLKRRGESAGGRHCEISASEGADDNPYSAPASTDGA
jgi:hypothetical protein